MVLWMRTFELLTLAFDLCYPFGRYIDLPRKVVAYEGEAVIFRATWKLDSMHPSLRFNWSERHGTPVRYFEKFFYTSKLHSFFAPWWRHPFEMNRYYIDEFEPLSLVITGFTAEDTRPKCITIKSDYPYNFSYKKCSIIEFHAARPTIPDAPAVVTSAGRNLALHSFTYQVDTWGGGNASLAVDGDNNPWYNGSSCTHTTRRKNPWWAVDLVSHTDIHFIIITNRKDCCSDRLSHIRIGTTDDSPARYTPTLKNINICSHEDETPGASTRTTFVCRAIARFVVIMLEKTDFLTLCEVEVYGANNNLALKAVTFQADVYGGASALRAVDGDLNPDFNEMSCTHTNRRRNPWWAVDLNSLTHINYVTITNRKDCCWDRLSNLRIGTMNDRATPTLENIDVCASQNDALAAGERKTFTCRAFARYVVVMIEKTDFLTLCEVEVYKAGNNLALNAVTFQADVSEGALASRAVDGNNYPIWSYRSCAKTTIRLNPWWAVDLNFLTTINFVIITNRKDCCWDSLSNLSIGTTNDNPAELPHPTPQNIDVCASHDAALGAGERKTFSCKALGRYVVVIIEKTDVLSLCEVEVYGDNIAYGQRTNQSSTSSEGQSHLAVDGIENAHYTLSRSCTHTMNHRHPWWSVDFGRICTLGRVVITNRGDCCEDRLSNLTIGTTDVDPSLVAPVLGEYVLCANVQGYLGLGETRSIRCVATSRFLVILLEKIGVLTLCEVQVFEENIALGKRTFQKSTNTTYNGESRHAVDGRTNTNPMISPCTYTHNTPSPWWAVDMMYYYSIYKVVITNRGDCCTRRSGQLHIGVSQFSTQVRPPNLYNMYQCGKMLANLGSGESRPIPCMAVARYLIILLSQQSVLTLCEVQVFSDSSAIAYSNFQHIDLTFEGSLAEIDIISGQSNDDEAQTDKAATIGGGIVCGVGIVVIVAIIAGIAHRYRKKPEEEEENLPAAISPTPTTAAVAATDEPGVKIN